MQMQGFEQPSSLRKVKGSSWKTKKKDAKFPTSSSNGKCSANMRAGKNQFIPLLKVNGNKSKILGKALRIVRMAMGGD